MTTIGRETDMAGPQIIQTEDMPDWSDAACKGLGRDPHPFFPLGPGNHHGNPQPKVEAAKAICRTCPIIEACAEWAIARSEDGVWGGLSEGERRDIRHQRRTTSVAS